MEEKYVIDLGGFASHVDSISATTVSQSVVAVLRFGLGLEAVASEVQSHEGSLRIVLGREIPAEHYAEAAVNNTSYNNKFV